MLKTFAAKIVEWIYMIIVLIKPIQIVLIFDSFDCDQWLIQKFNHNTQHYTVKNQYIFYLFQSKYSGYKSTTLFFITNGLLTCLPCCPPGWAPPAAPSPGFWYGWKRFDDLPDVLFMCFGLPICCVIMRKWVLLLMLDYIQRALPAVNILVLQTDIYKPW